MQLANIPVVFIWLWFALRARKLFFFSAVNPAIQTGGLLGETKFDILRQIPEKYIPCTRLITGGTPWKEVEKTMQEAGLSYPVICKPNIGERGFLVTKVHNSRELQAFLQKCPADFLLQAFVDLPLELSIMHHRFPGHDKGEITSICIKEHLHVTGDGKSSIRQLMQGSDRALLQLVRFEAEQADLLNQIPPNGSKIELEPIGNHSRGAMFLNGNPKISTVTTSAFDDISRGMQGIYYGRFDLKCGGWQSLQTGEQIQIVEYNGIGGEPAHIYDPALPIWQKYRDIYHHWKIIFRLYLEQRKRGIPAMRIKEGLGYLMEYRRYMKEFKL